MHSHERLLVTTSRRDGLTLYMHNVVNISGYVVEFAAFNSHIRQSLQYCTADAVITIAI